MATTTPNFGWPVPTSTDLVKDGATAIEALGDSIDASLLDLKGGTTGQVLSKNSNTDMDFTWVTDAAGDITGVTAGTGISGGGTSGTVTVTNSMATAIDAKGDLVAGTAADTFARLAVGSNGTVLTADSAEATGLKWVAPSSGALTLLSTTSFSAVSSISLPTDSFTATYDDYLVILNITTSSTGQYIQARLRSAGTDNTASTYASGYFAVLMGSSTTVNDNGGATQTSFTKFGYAENALPSYSLAYIRSPKAARRTAYTGSLVGYANEQLLLGGTFSNTTSFDSMTFIVSGTITGAVSVYGISK